MDRRSFLRSCAGLGLATACGGAPEPQERIPGETLALHREIPVFDLHIDTLLWMRWLGYDIAEAHGNPLPRASFFSHMDLPRAEEAGLRGAVLGLVINPVEVEPELIAPLRWLARFERGSGLEQTLATLDLLAAEAERLSDRLVFARSGSEARRAIESGRFAGVAGLEGVHGIEDRLENAAAAHARGLRMIGLVHFQRSAAAFPMTEPAFDDRGLTPFGFDLLAECKRLGIVVDLAHVNSRGVDDALGALRQPFVVSHTACAALQPNPRNLTDDQIQRIAERGGVIGLAVGRSFLGRPGIEGFLDHVEHVIEKGGSRAVAIGSDWDGAIVPAEGMEDVRALPHVTQGLIERGYGEKVLRRVMGENALGVLTEVCG